MQGPGNTWADAYRLLPKCPNTNYNHSPLACHTPLCCTSHLPVEREVRLPKVIQPTFGDNALVGADTEGINDGWSARSLAAA